MTGAHAEGSLNGHSVSRWEETARKTISQRGMVVGWSVVDEPFARAVAPLWLPPQAAQLEINLKSQPAIRLVLPGF